MRPRPPNRGERRVEWRGVVHRQSRENLALKRFGVGAMSLVVAFFLWVAPAGAQERFTLGMTGGT